jgi:hypothetical protein
VAYGNGSYLKFGDNKFEGTKLLMTIMAAASARFACRHGLADVNATQRVPLEFAQFLGEMKWD